MTGTDSRPEDISMSSWTTSAKPSKPPGLSDQLEELKFEMKSLLELGRAAQRAAGDRAMLSCHGIRQTLEGSFSAVSKPNFASKYAFESSRRDLHNALLRTAPKSHFFQKLVEFAKICEII